MPPIVPSTHICITYASARDARAHRAHVTRALRAVRRTDRQPRRARVALVVRSSVLLGQAPTTTESHACCPPSSQSKNIRRHAPPLCSRRGAKHSAGLAPACKFESTRIIHTHAHLHSHGQPTARFPLECRRRLRPPSHGAIHQLIGTGVSLSHSATTGAMHITVAFDLPSRLATSSLSHLTLHATVSLV